MAVVLPQKDDPTHLVTVGSPTRRSGQSVTLTFGQYVTLIFMRFVTLSEGEGSPLANQPALLVHLPFEQRTGILRFMLTLEIGNPRI